ncbi:dihydrofolate reductase family protein [Brevibacterium album]|uniref:dihydrofolate reductase family protein n=1 Tax=Brevibacterium album TaxID=417948 RepID=UPI00041EC5A4|nr:dihydrofolate reductase family protein [Brevibacterium album]
MSTRQQGTPLTLVLPEHRPYPPEADEAGLIDLYSDLSRAPRRPSGTAPAGTWVRANMVASLDGQVVGGDGRSGTISSPADKRVFSVLRSLADAVVVGGRTARTERYTRLSAKRAHQAQRRARGQAPAPVLVLVSRSGDVDLDRLDEAGTSAVLVHAAGAHMPEARVREVRARLGADSLVLHEDEVSPREILRDLAARGLHSIVHEGGPGVLGAWTAAGCLDELCLTVSPVLTGRPHPQGQPHGSDQPRPGAPGAAGPPRSILGDAELPGAQGAVPLSVLTDGTTLIQRWGLAPAP